jgi:hypothetical protein
MTWDRFVAWVMSERFDRLVLMLALSGAFFSLVAHFVGGS